MSTHRRPWVTFSLIAVVAVAALLSSCGSSDSSDGEGTTSSAPDAAAGAPSPGQEAATAAKADGRTVIDVRTPEEFAQGHVDGATLVNFQDPGFADAIAALDATDTYVVYCRSGNRSAQAATQMRAIGLDVTDGGGLPDMVAAGWPTA